MYFLRFICFPGFESDKMHLHQKPEAGSKQRMKIQFKAIIYELIKSGVKRVNYKEEERQKTTRKLNNTNHQLSGHPLWFRGIDGQDESLSKSMIALDDS